MVDALLICAIVECPLGGHMPAMVFFFKKKKKSSTNFLHYNQVWRVQMLVYHQYWSPWNSVWNFVVLRLVCWRTWQRQSIWFIYGKILLKVVTHCWTMLTVLNKIMKGEAENIFLIGILFVCFFFFKHPSSSSLKILWSITYL